MVSTRPFPTRGESIAAVLDACDGHGGIDDDGTGPRSRALAPPAPPWFKELAEVAKRVREQPPPRPPAMEAHRCEHMHGRRRCAERFKRRVPSTRRYCDGCYVEINQAARERGRRRAAKEGTR